MYIKYIQFYSDIGLHNELHNSNSEYQLISVPQDQIISSGQNENETSSPNESTVVADSVNLSQSDDVEIKGVKLS